MSAYGSRVIDGPEFLERLKDLGSSEVDAAMIVESRRLEVARQRANAGAGWGPQSLRLGGRPGPSRRTLSSRRWACWATPATKHRI
jgi:hypothetical protein